MQFIRSRRTFFQENHEKAVFSVEFCNNLRAGEPVIFASCGINRVSIYECRSNGAIKLLQCYSDPCDCEVFYTCCWSFDRNTFQPILAAGGLNRIIRIINCTTMISLKHFIGHGQAINDLKFYPRDPSILLSASKDHSIRLWNIETEVCIAIFGGIEGHQSQVLSVDFDVMGNRIASCGLDHTVKIWNLDTELLKGAIKASGEYNANVNRLPFPTIADHFPIFSSGVVHQNYVDCIKWMGNLILSKVCVFVLQK